MVNFSTALTQVWRRPRAWVLFYLLVSLPAAGVGMLLTLAWMPLLRSPLLRWALETRRLDFALDFLLGMPLTTQFELVHPYNGLPTLGFTALGVCGVLLIWPLFGLLWVALEGAALTSYAAPESISWRAFWQGAKRWFGPFLLLNSLGVVLAGLALAVLLGAGYALSGMYPTLGKYVSGLGWALAGGIGTLVELMRAAAVARDTRHPKALARCAFQALRQKPGAIAALVGGGLIAYGLLALAYRGLMAVLPFSWWLAVILVQQSYIALRLGVRLSREAGMVAWVQALNEEG